MLRLALASKTGDINDGLRAIVRALIAKAMDGDMTAIKEVADRLDGRPAQAVTVGGDSGGLPVWVEHVIIDPANTSR